MPVNFEVIALPERPTAVVRGHVQLDGISPFLGEAFAGVAADVTGEGAHIAGPPFARYELTADGFEIEAGFPLDRAVRGLGRVEASVLPGGTAARTLHVGPYREIGLVYEAAERWLLTHGYVAAGSPWESYLDGPEVAAPRTEVYFPCTPREHADPDPGAQPDRE